MQKTPSSSRICLSNTLLILMWLVRDHTLKKFLTAGQSATSTFHAVSIPRMIGVDKQQSNKFSSVHTLHSSPSLAFIPSLENNFPVPLKSLHYKMKGRAFHYAVFLETLSSKFLNKVDQLLGGSLSFTHYCQITKMYIQCQSFLF